ncbi:hypothetical protein E4U43_001762 [Claviceps pusilla]|uniref:Uncharacterized protein n=1 Tax=Claviceps pusilla TaxID=123648 RepID=A0A9P7N995_9HYPO|nr:hypothetical protein E4U43_001762 [Claviceps pusilla]
MLSRDIDPEQSPSTIYAAGGARPPPPYTSSEKDVGDVGDEENSRLETPDVSDRLGPTGRSTTLRPQTSSDWPHPKFAWVAWVGSQESGLSSDGGDRTSKAAPGAHGSRLAARGSLLTAHGSRLTAHSSVPGQGRVQGLILIRDQTRQIQDPRSRGQRLRLLPR